MLEPAQAQLGLEPGLPGVRVERRHHAGSVELGQLVVKYFEAERQL
jgi:hypothetical protein